MTRFPNVRTRGPDANLPQTELGGAWLWELFIWRMTVRTCLA